ncbi:MAG: phosphodiester glycosidase family protein [Bacteroidaceae bacterium]|nr:phosphodiester glycosidase family protein [Bacteroidaceae bacterium]
MNDQHPHHHAHEHQEPEVPIITIEREEEPRRPINQSTQPPKRNWLRWVAIVSLLLAVASGIVAGLMYWDYHYNIGVTLSATPQENIEKLARRGPSVKPEVVMTSDSVLGVRLDLYELRGLRGELTYQRPDTADASVYLYCRANDYRADGSMLGSLVMDGKVVATDDSRLGYFAAVGQRMVIGVGRNEAVMNYVAAHEGHYFRQFVLVSNGELPTRFFLHGKVERRALGRIGDQLYLIATPHPETLWAFADALREYGFVDAIYITGGNKASFYRDAQGKIHEIGQPEPEEPSRKKVARPWLVFRR